MKKFKRIGRTLLDPNEITFAAWHNEKLIICVSGHTLTFDKPEGDRIWKLLDGDNVPEWDARPTKPGTWK